MSAPRTGLPPRTGVFSIHELRASGTSRADIDAALELGALRRVRRGWYAIPESNPDAAEAVYLGGALTSVSAGPLHGLWSLRDDRLHVAVPHNASRLRYATDSRGVRVDRQGRQVCLHWVQRRGPFGNAVVDVDRVLMDAAACQPEEVVIALADSVLNQRILHEIEVESCIPHLFGRCDGASQSGTESIVRLRLERRGIRTRSQVYIPGVGYVDLLVGDRLIIECDSSEYHEGYGSPRDYDRDLALAELGYLVVRLRYDHVIHHWDRAERAILAIVRERRHLRRAGRPGERLTLG